uniref:Uncharacterized protein n=1 Tax=viral metagenome TaxID=1070528 RepID=A0A6M3K515_9ZZZZ
MSKQEEIQEGMWEFILEVRHYLCNTEFALEPFTTPVDIDVLKGMGVTQLKKMDSQGVVIIGNSLGASHPHLGSYYTIEPLIKGGLANV